MRLNETEWPLTPPCTTIQFSFKGIKHLHWSPSWSIMCILKFECKCWEHLGSHSVPKRRCPPLSHCTLAVHLNRPAIICLIMITIKFLLSSEEYFRRINKTHKLWTLLKILLLPYLTSATFSLGAHSAQDVVGGFHSQFFPHRLAGCEVDSRHICHQQIVHHIMLFSFTPSPNLALGIRLQWFAGDFVWDFDGFHTFHTFLGQLEFHTRKIQSSWLMF